QGTLLPLGGRRATTRAMPRAARDALGGYCYHVLNRGNGRRTVFHKPGDFAAFARLLREAGQRIDMRLVGYCLLPNHFHLLLWPHRDGDLSSYMMWLMTAHVRRYHRHYHSSGHVWQGRFRSFPIQEDDHLLTVHEGPGLALVERRAAGRGVAAAHGQPGAACIGLARPRQRAADRSRGRIAAGVYSPPSPLRRGDVGRPNRPADGPGGEPATAWPTSEGDGDGPLMYPVPFSY